MNQEGYDIVRAALDAHPETEHARIVPEPKFGENVRDVEIHGKGLKSDAIRTVLREAGLMRMSLDPHKNSNAPSFAWAGSDKVQRGVVYKFTDKNV
jgi:hypothetical protein